MMRELIDTDLEAVAGGTVNVASISIPTLTQTLLQNNSLNQTGVAIGGSVVQVAGPQSNTGVQAGSIS
ncbi:hypothetical protein [Bradyrhizobium sp. CCGUVB23]|uniref:hypothetical protein n=1 Tax=Bradyrhizobium sp. CCGUVB23 TaxID=2949630 RepID=UPI0020B20AEB|nr:hypothetical protein [Bradyrhizobium sp. CCGUVB23]MCP3459468.1 hypothetical protein [Bradyrhizobium sp. CCGUVB23]MCP3464743.1 hypothetical protein [Bradyrhizobium sp. CCGUVB23]MCP3466475.1 hypothetical protein [Bradyrhizobium sp. CCGUVB23]